MNPKIVFSITTVIALLGLSFGPVQAIPLPPLNDAIHRPVNADSGSDHNFGNISTEGSPLDWYTITRITSDLPDPSQRFQEFTVSVSVSSFEMTPPGLVVVSTTPRGGGCTIRLENGRGSCSIMLPGGGDYTLTARYFPTQPHIKPSSDTEPHRVSRAETTTTILSDLPDPSQAGQPFTVSFTVESDVRVPTGSVTVSESTGGTSCTGVLESGAGSCSMALAGAGTYNLTAAYAGDDDYLPSSDAEEHDVVKAETITDLLSHAPDPSMPTQPFTVTFSAASDWSTPTGWVTVTASSSGESCIGTLESGAGSCALALANAGMYTLTATYAGDDNHLSSMDTGDHNVAKAETATIILSDQPDPSLPGQPFTVTYNVTSEFTLPTGTVTVTVLDAGASCVRTLESGNGSCSLLLAEPGGYALTTTFSGDNNHLGSQAGDSHTVILQIITPNYIYLPVIDKGVLLQ